MTQIAVKGDIIADSEAWLYDFFGEDYTSPKRIRNALEDADDDITLEINSGGGNVMAANEIYYALQNSKKKITADIIGMSASAATIICCAANRVRAVPAAVYMIHNVTTGQYGDKNDMSHAVGVLSELDSGIASIYATKTGRTLEDILSMMNDETWMNATTAKERGFIDEIIKPDPAQAVAAIGRPRFTDKDAARAKAQMQLNLLKIKGEINNV